MIGHCEVQSTGLAPTTGQFEDTDMDFHSKCWANLSIRGQTCAFQAHDQALRHAAALVDGGRQLLAALVCKRRYRTDRASTEGAAQLWWRFSHDLS